MSLIAQVAELEKLRQLPESEEVRKFLAAASLEYDESKLARGLEQQTQSLFSEFYGSDPYAREVALGRASYHEIVEMLGQHYDTVWKKTFYPKKDQEFDTLLEARLKSLTSVVGEGYTIGNDTKRYAVDYTLLRSHLTTEGKRGESRSLNGLLAIGEGIGLGLSAVSGVPGYLLHMPNLTQMGGVILLDSTVIFSCMYGLAAARRAVYHKDLLNKILPKMASDADGFLRQHPPE
jgi:hypothetical protein